MCRNCRKCGESKPDTEFYDRQGRKQLVCKPCEKKRIKAWRDANPEKQREINRRGQYKLKYGLNVDDVPHSGECPLCLKEKRLVVDHCHTSGQVRGFICYNCNTLLGHIENTEKMARIEKYLSEIKS